MEVAARHHYVFDPEDFNFVAVRDRIRCYYKSFVQTARKRGLPHVGGSSSNANSNTGGGDGGGDVDGEADDAVMEQKQSKPRVQAE